MLFKKCYVFFLSSGFYKLKGQYVVSEKNV